MQGIPPAPEATVTLENWFVPPFNRWALQHARELMPTAPVPAVPDAPRLPRAERALGNLTFDHDGETWTVDQMVDATFTDGFLVLHRGAVVAERYANGLTPDAPHVLFSVTKSIVATLTGILVGRGELSPRDAVGDVIPELLGTSWGDATVQHLLDMRTGTRFNEVYEDMEGDMAAYTIAVGMGPRTEPDHPTDTYSFLASLPNDRPHGGEFDYRSAVTSMLGWVCERAGGERLHTLLSRDLWGPMGAQRDASIVVDPYGNPMAAGGLSVTLQDLARFGQLWLDHGWGRSGSVVPEAWVTDTLTGDPDSSEVFAASLETPDPDHPRAFYRNKWWILDPALPSYTGIGIEGQFVMIHEPAAVVIAKLSSLPAADDPEFERLQLRGFTAIAESLAG